MGAEAEMVGVILNTPQCVELQGNRFFPLALPERASGDTPWSVYQLISGPGEYSHGGRSGFENVVYQISAWAGNYTDSKNLAQALANALEAHRGDYIPKFFVNHMGSRREGSTRLIQTILEVEFFPREL